MKNQLLQAACAIRYADLTGRILYFHMNTGRVEEGSQELKNIKALFEGTCHNLVEHPWLSHNVFLGIMMRMDKAMCVSLSETFCITAADATVVGVPLLCSAEVPWACKESIVPATDAEAVVEGLLTLSDDSVRKNKVGLRRYSRKSLRVWLEYLGVRERSFWDIFR
jgi:hypothetical protein